ALAHLHLLATAGGLTRCTGWRCRQANGEQRTFANLARDRDVASHHPAELARDGEAESGPAVLTRRCAVDASACENSSNSLAICSGAMPMPVSVITNSMKLAPSRPVRRALNDTCPRSVNLQAFLNRLSRICRSRMGSMSLTSLR